MGKNSYSVEEIKVLIRSGWNFRIKKVHGKNYITRRKGQTEKSLGRYDENLWKLIETLTGKKQPSLSGTMAERLDKAQILFEKWDNELGVHRGFIAMNSCVFVDREEYCMYYRFENKPNFSRHMEKLMGTDFLKLTACAFWVHKANIRFCKNCHAYISREMKDKILEGLHDREQS
jgi:hypothetical protein